MADSIFHRGPDDYGYLLADSANGATHAGKGSAAAFLPDVLLACRRLAITDLSSAGAQPMANEDNTVFVVFNGAIHNFVELRAELETRGHRFRSHTDTEVIVHAYEEWGADCVRHFNGMWAYVIWDSRRRELVCSRDRFGIKPLYIVETNGAFYFASEIKAILAAGEIALHPRFSSIGRFVRQRMPVEGVETAFEGIESVPPGCNLVIRRERIVRQRYWDYRQQSQTYDYAHPEATFRELLSDATRIRLRADVPVALLLSGGLDSTAVGGGIARHQLGGGLAFTATFPGFAGDEFTYARAAAAHYRLSLRRVEYDASSLLDDLKSLAWHMEVPATLTQMPARWQLLGAAAREAPVVFEGQGGDELLGGYPTHQQAAARRDHHRAEAAAAALSLFHAARSYLARRLRKRTSSRLPNIASRNIPRVEPSFAHFPDVKHSDEVNDILVADHAHNTLPFLLHMSDSIAMAHSVETRLPFLDHRLVEFMFGLPSDQKIRGRQSKFILRSALAAEMPPVVLQRRDKIGFDTPVDTWLATHQTEVFAILHASAKSRGVFNQARLEKFFATYQPSPATSSLVYRALAVESWFQVFVDGDRPARRPSPRPTLSLSP